MNHDYAHCADYQPDCPKECFRGQLVRDLSRHPQYRVSWMHFEGTEECKKVIEREKSNEQIFKTEGKRSTEEETQTKNIMEQQKTALERLRMKYAEEFLKLVKENPDLPIIPMVNEEIVSDDSYSWWMGSWGRSEVTGYYVGREHVHFKDDDEEDVLNDMVGCGYGEDLRGRDIYDLTDEEWKELYNSIPWTKAIVVYITT